MSAKFTCITCKVLFHEADLQRDHYKSDWHRYNLKRKVASLQPVTLEEFDRRAQEHRQSAQEASRDCGEFCKCCSKAFSTRNAYDNHLLSKKHKRAAELYVPAPAPAPVGAAPDRQRNSSHSDDSFVKVEADRKLDHKGHFVVLSTNSSDDEDIETDSEIEELDSDEWEECRIKGSDSLIAVRDCLFCGHHSRTMVKSLRHMLQQHSFFIPDVEYCVDLKGLLLYLGEKISRGYMCLWCNETGRTFYSLEAARAHMLDKGHCKMMHEGIALAEYTDFYDYSTSYPDHVEGDEDMEVETPVVDLDSEDYQLVLPSGATVGHRSLMRYYKQHLSGEQAVVVRKGDRRLHRVLGQYRALGWAPREQAATARRARDIHFMKRVQAKWQMKMSLKSNKFQTHYRAQVNF